MVLDSKIATVKAYFGVTTLEDWRSVDPGWILKMHGIGPATLDHIRLYLAPHGITLKNDATPEYWLSHQSKMKICQQMGESDEMEVAPFTITIDSREQAPWMFQNLAPKDKPPLIIPVKVAGLRSGDYSIAGFEDHIAIERKSHEDAIGTFTSGRDRFERELERLNTMQVAFVIIEKSLGDFMMGNGLGWHFRGSMQAVMDGIDAWINRYPKVHWWWMPTKFLAEKKAYKILSRFWRDWYSKADRENPPKDDGKPRDEEGFKW